MDTLTNKNILLGITGSIAAYKAADISSRLKKEGCNIRVIMTKSSELFITETTLESLSGNKVICENENSTALTVLEESGQELSLPVHALAVNFLAIPILFTK